MRVDGELVSYLEELSALALSEEEKRRLTGDLDEILGYMARLSELDTKDVPAGYRLAGDARARGGVVTPSVNREKLLQNAPKSGNGTIIAPRTV